VWYLLAGWGGQSCLTAVAVPYSEAASRQGSGSSQSGDVRVDRNALTVVGDERLTGRAGVVRIASRKNARTEAAVIGLASRKP